MIIELSDFFNNPSLISVGSISIQYYAITWILSAIFIYLHLANNSITKEIGISKEKANDLVFLYGLIFGAMIGGRIGYMLFYGFDQLINVCLPTLASSNFFLKFYNSDGSEAGMCLNGIRCASKYIWQNNFAPKGKINIQTKSKNII